MIDFTISPAPTVPPVPCFSFEDAGARSLVAVFAADWGDAQAAEGWHSGLLVAPEDLDAQGRIEARAILARGDARTDDSRAFEAAFYGAWSDAYAARIITAERRGW